MNSANIASTSAAVGARPKSARHCWDPGQRAEGLDVRPLVGPHGPARVGRRDDDAAATEDLQERRDRRHAAVIDRGARPIEEDRLDVYRHARQSGAAVDIDPGSCSDTRYKLG